MEPRLAATVVLLRSSRSGLEVLLTRRPTSMAFAPDMHVFPGGSVDAADRDARLVARSVVTPSRAAVALGGDLSADLAIAVYIAAIREVFEESGVLLADRSGLGPGEAPGETLSPTISIGRFRVAGTAPEDPAAPSPNGDRWEDPAAPPPISQRRWAGGSMPPAGAISQARSALVGGDADFATIVAELDLTLRTDWLVPLSRWVTPPILPRRFDARFFAAALPAGARVSFEGDEVAGHAWMTPASALTAMANHALAMWIPTSGTLQQLRWVGSLDEIRERLAPGRLGEPFAEVISPEITRIVMPAGGGVAGQPIASYLVGRRRFVLIDPGDPLGPGLDLAMAIAAERSGVADAIGAIALTQVAPDHAAGAEALAEILAIPILAGPASGRSLPFDVRELDDDETIDATDTELRAIHAPGPSPEGLAFAVGQSHAVVGDLDGSIGARTVPRPPDPGLMAASQARIAERYPDATWLGAHPATGPI